MKIPKLRMVYYKSLMDICMMRFFDDFNSSFSNDGGRYVLAQPLSRSQLQSVMKSYLAQELQKIVVPFSHKAPDAYLVLGACSPKDNLFLKAAKKNELSPKLSKLLQSSSDFRYVLKEKDIKIDMQFFQDVFLKMFDQLFKNQKKVQDLLQSESYSNVFFIKHKHLDCYQLFKTIKLLYGKSNCWNVHKEKLSKQHAPLVAVNDVIDLQLKKDLKKIEALPEYKVIKEEVKQYIDAIRRN